MRQDIEKKLNSVKLPQSREEMASTIRAKKRDGLTLTKQEETFLREQQEDNQRDDNPRYGN